MSNTSKRSRRNPPDLGPIFSRCSYEEPGSAPGSVGGGSTSVTSGSADIRGHQITVSEGHPYRGFFDGTDQGGDFFTQRTWVSDPGSYSFESTESGWSNKRKSKTTWDGVRPMVVPSMGPAASLFVPSAPPSVAPLALQWELVPFGVPVGLTGRTPEIEMDARGASFVANLRPGESPANMAAALIELKNDGLPSLLGASTWKDRSKPSKGASGEFLNYQFGILPLLSDVKDAGSAVIHATSYIKQALRDEGKLVRRKQKLDPMITTESLHSGRISPTIIKAPGTWTGTTGKYQWQYDVVRRTEVTWSFSGAFQYYLGENFRSSNELIRNAARFKWLLGLDLNPATVYQVSPWSWLADWFANLGDVISNVNSFANDGLVMPYGYVMKTTRVTVEASVRAVGDANTSISYCPREFSTTYNLVQKERRKANPFGFGLTHDGLSIKQKAILAALGITRMR